MIIGFDGSRAFVKNKTGTENYSYQLLRALVKVDQKNNYKVFVRPGVKIGNDWPDNFKFLILNFKFLWTQAGLSLQTFKEKLDVLFVPAHTLPIIRKPGLKTVVTVHDLGSQYLPKMHQLKQRAYLSLMQSYQLKTASKIIAVSNATREDLIKKIGINPKKIKVAYEGYDQKLFKQSKTDTLVNSLIPYFLFVGTVQPRKNLERIIRAFARIKDEQSSPLDKNLVVAGEKGWMSDEIYELPKKLGIEKNVKFLGYVPEKDLPALYSNAKALVFSSLFEGFGLPILEAQACGCPVITSNLSSMPEIASPPAGGGAIFVDPYSIDDIVEGIRRIEDRRLRMEMIKAGLENVKRFSWEKCAKETLKVLENI